MTETQRIAQYQAFVNCPTLWHASQAPFSLFSFPWRECVSATQDIFIPENIVFGRKMESFFSHALSHSQRYDVLAENLQIISNKVTLGELDFLVRDNNTGQLIHVELACKFYLLDPNRKVQNEYSPWVGPNQNDFLDYKIEKLKDQQLPLLNHPECKKLLVPLTGFSASKIIQQVYFPAHLFLPYGQSDIPKNVNPDAVQGFWLQPEKLQSNDFKDAQFHLPPKDNWLIQPNTDEDWIDHPQALQQINEMHQRKKSPLVWVKFPDAKFERLFVVWW